MNPPIALCIGHSRIKNGRTEGGAVNHDGSVNEWTWNRDLADRITTHLAHHRVNSILVDRYQGTGYGGAMRWLAEHLKKSGVTLAVELHFNSAGPTARGHEWIHWHSSTAGRRLAEHLDAEMCLQGTGIPRRGLKTRRAGDNLPDNRGWQFLAYTHCRAVICEPFFGSSPADFAAATLHKDRIARAIAEGIINALED